MPDPQAPNEGKTSPPSIIDAVLKSIAQEGNFLGGGDEANVYTFEGRDDWVIRVTDANAIAGTVELTEAHDIYEGRNLGQAIYKGAGFTINRRQPGEGPKHIIARLYDQYKQDGSRFPESRALNEYWQQMANLPEASYENLMLDMNAATKAGRAIDPNNCNYLVDFSQNPPRIGWVDIGLRGAYAPPNSVENVRYAILTSTTRDLKAFNEENAEWALEDAAHRGDTEAQDLKKQLQEARAIIREKIIQAGQFTKTPATYRDVEPYERAIEARKAVAFDEASRKFTPKELYHVAQPASPHIAQHPEGTYLETPANTPHPVGASARAAGTGVQGYMAYAGMMMMGHGATMIQSGDVALGAANIAVGAANFGAGAVGAFDAVAPGALSTRAAEILERTNIPLMAASGAVEIYNAPADKKGEAAARAMITNTSAFVAGDVVAATGMGATGGILLPMGVAIGAGLLLDRGLEMQALEQAHNRKMNAMKPDDSYSHLRAQADQLQNTLTTAYFGDSFEHRDERGKISLESEKNLAKMKESLTPEQWNKVQDECLKQAKKTLDAQEMTMRASGDLDLRSQEEQQKSKEAALTQLAAKFERSSLQGMITTVELARQSRTDYVPKEAELYFGDDGKILLNDFRNLKTLRDVFTRMHDAAAQGIENSESVSYYWNMLDGKQQQAARFNAEALGKTADVALSELNALQWHGGKEVTRTPEQTAIDIQQLNEKAQANAKANKGKQTIRADYFYVEDKDHNLISTDTRNAKMPLDIADDYHNAVAAYAQKGEKPPAVLQINQVLYEDDGKGGKEPSRIAVWHIVNQELLQEKEKAAGNKPHNYITDVKYAVADYISGTITMDKDGAARNYEQEFMQLLENNQALKGNKELRTKVMKEAKNLTTYFTKGTDAEGNDLSKGQERFKDGKMDKGEFEAALRDINAKFKDRGIALATNDAANMVAQNKPAGIQTR